MRRPLVILGLVALVLGGLCAWQLPNYLRKPALHSIIYASEGCRLDFFSDGVRPRETAFFFRSGGREILLDVVNDSANSLAGDSFGSLRWTRDRGALVATALENGKIETDKPIWVFDIGRMIPVPPGDRENEVTRRGGLGERVYSFYELGRAGRSLFSWQADSWRARVKKVLEAANTAAKGPRDSSA